MTLDYKILGQLYYGPEINETPEIPGTSGYYTSVTGEISDMYVSVSVFSDVYVYSRDGVTWTLGLMPSNANWVTVTYGDGKFVALAMYGVAAYSTDGINWTQISIPSWFSYSTAYGNGKFVSVNENSILYSTDGISWTLAGNSPSLKYIAYGNGKFIGVGSGLTNVLGVSTDGITWEQMTLPYVQLWSKPVYGDGQFVLVGYNNQTQTHYGARSNDGYAWSGSLLPSYQTWATLAYGNGKFVALSSQNSAYSTDAFNWTQIESPTFSATNFLVYGNGKFVALGGQKSVYSIDGITWVESVLPGSQIWYDFTYAQINTLVEVQISIGGQGTPGSYVEIVEPQVLYTVPSGTETTVTSIYVTNHDSVQRTYDLAVVPAGETLSLKHHIRWDMPVASSDFDLANAKLTLSAGDKIYVFPSTVNKVGFTAFGVEKS